MSRDWAIRAANGQGQVLACSRLVADLEGATGAAELTPDGNINILSVVNVGDGDSTLDIDASKSIIGDVIILLIQTDGSVTANVDLGGDAAAGRCTVFNGVGAYYLIYNGEEYFATATPTNIP